MLMFFGCMSLISGFSDGVIPSIQPALMFGFVVSTVITIIGHISGAHLNPSVTVAAVVLGDMSLLDGLMYILSQCIGCTLGFATLRVVTPNDILTFGIPPDRGLCNTIPHHSLSDAQAFAGPYTGASMNPARSLGPAIVNNIWTKLWVSHPPPVSRIRSGSVLGP
ncbi:hypothetical protein WDU94_014184 [Cyamophila willieti]